MQISWHGFNCVRLQGKDVVVVMDPFSPDTGLKLSRSQADIVTLSREDLSADEVPGEPFVIEVPGEYEAKGAFIYGMPHKTKDGQSVVIYRVNLEDISMGHVAGLDAVPSGDLLEMLEGIDVLFVPAGGDLGVTPALAAELVNTIEPRIVVPVDYHVSGSKEKRSGPEAFLKELGAKPETVDKLKLVKKDLPTDERRVYLIEQS
jgi:L-ascorbate metabolism protein UlaG (beta-lactamase superfamily)